MRIQQAFLRYLGWPLRPCATRMTERGSFSMASKQPAREYSADHK